MFRNMSIRKRIMVILALVYVVSLSIAVSVGYYVLRKDTVRESLEKTELFSAAMTGSQQYLASNIRPKTLQLLPNTYFPEATVGILMLTEVARNVEKLYPGYIFRIASHNPLNMENMADEFEQNVIHAFSMGDYEEWKGFMDRGGKAYYAMATPISAGQNCIWCHDTPERVHPTMVEQYGTRSGYGYKLGEIVGGRFVYVPAQTAIEEARKKLAWFAGGFSLFFLLAMVAVDQIIVRSVVRPIENFVSVAADISRGKMDREFEVKTNDEIKMLADAFKRMKVSLAKAMDILRE